MNLAPAGIKHAGFDASHRANKTDEICIKRRSCFLSACFISVFFGNKADPLGCFHLTS